MNCLMSASVCFVACHGGPADHFAVFAEHLIQKGYQVEVYASGPATEKLSSRGIKAIAFDTTEPEAAETLAKKCAQFSVVITDVGHQFDLDLQQALKQHALKTVRLAYYDNPESFVPGGYSSLAEKVMLAADQALFANARLVQEIKIELPVERRIGLGYYPVEQPERIASKRASDHALSRCKFFSDHAAQDRGQKLFVYAGGNNSEYFDKALPAFLEMLSQACQKEDLSKLVIVLQQHPGAKGLNLDKKQIEQWMLEHSSSEKSPQWVISTWNSNDIQIAADCMLYYQTSMGPQFVLAGLPVIQVGHHVYEDVLVRNQLCATAINPHQLLTHIQAFEQKQPSDHALIMQGLGILPDWRDHLEKALRIPS